MPRTSSCTCTAGSSASSRNDVMYAIRLLGVMITLSTRTTTTTTTTTSVYAFHVHVPKPILTYSTIPNSFLNTNKNHQLRPSKLPSILKLVKHDVEDNNNDDDDDDDNDDDYYDDDDENDSYIDLDTLDDWRSFRKSLLSQQNQQSGVFDEQPTQQLTQRNDVLPSIETQESNNLISSSSSSSTQSKWTTTATTTSTTPETKNTNYCIENYNKLKEQNSKLAIEYKSNVWVHKTSTAEVGGIIVRNPLEVELYINHRHSLNGALLRRQLESSIGNNSDKKRTTSTVESTTNNNNNNNKKKNIKRTADTVEPVIWYRKAQILIEQQMKKIADLANDSGQIETSSLNDDQAEMLQLYLDNQENWQEVCLVLKSNDSRTETLVLNRPMAFKLTPNLAQLILFGSFSTPTTTTTTSPSSQDSLTDYRKGTSVLTEHERKKRLLQDFVLAFRESCGIYIGGTDNQHREGIIIHGIPGLRNSREVSPGTGIYEGGLEDAIHGVLDGKYNSNEFRFFVGKNVYENKKLDVDVILGKYQPMACHYSIILKQCIALPKPFWNEVNTLCGGLQKDIVELETLKHSQDDSVQFQIIDDDDDDDDDDMEFFKEDDDLDYLNSVDIIKFDYDDDDDDDDDDDEEDYILYYNK